MSVTGMFLSSSTGHVLDIVYDPSIDAKKQDSGKNV